MDTRIELRAHERHPEHQLPNQRGGGPGDSGPEGDSGPGGGGPRAGRAEVSVVRIAGLVLDGSPRLRGEDVGHTRLLAQTGASLPPILVHRPTMRVVDGVHRVQAARLLGETEIRAVFFDGGENAAFVKAVEANVSHGLPLSIDDRRVAAARIIALYPEWSDRAVAAAAGLSPKTARAIRDRLTNPADQAVARVGRDGKVRPLSTAESRRRAAALIAERPSASLREIASSAGVSLATARDVRQRVRNGESPVPLGVRHGGQRDRTRSVPSARAGAVRQLHQVAASSEAATSSLLLQRLKGDPSLRYSEKGRSLLRWLDSHVVDPADWSPAVAEVPPHCTYTIAELALRCAKAWERLAEEMWVRVDGSGSGAAA
ncbi:MAG: streptomycin biosynthesis protein [Micromonosporaceae bacterium]|nr:streptomycin biosynthesis protein [Micromonosporaceae bacterium]